MNSIDRIIGKVEDVELALSRLLATQSEENQALNELLICMTNARILVEKQRSEAAPTKFVKLGQAMEFYD